MFSLDVWKDSLKCEDSGSERWTTLLNRRKGVTYKHNSFISEISDTLTYTSTQETFFQVMKNILICYYYILYYPIRKELKAYKERHVYCVFE